MILALRNKCKRGSPPRCDSFSMHPKSNSRGRDGAPHKNNRSMKSTRLSSECIIKKKKRGLLHAESLIRQRASTCCCPSTTITTNHHVFFYLMKHTARASSSHLLSEFKSFHGASFVVPFRFLIFYLSVSSYFDVGTILIKEKDR